MQFQTRGINPAIIIHRTPHPTAGECTIFAVGGYPPLHDLVAKAVQRPAYFGIVVYHEYPDYLQAVTGGDIGGIFALLEFLLAGVLDAQFCPAGRAGAMFPRGSIVEYLSAVEAGNDTFFRALTYRFDDFGICPS